MRARSTVPCIGLRGEPPCAISWKANACWADGPINHLSPNSSRKGCSPDSHDSGGSSNAGLEARQRQGARARRDPPRTIVAIKAYDVKEFRLSDVDELTTTHEALTGSEFASHHDRCHPPKHVADVVRHKQCSEIGHGNADRTTKRFAVFIEETGQDISRLPGAAPIGEWHKNHLVSAFRYAVPGAVLPNENAFRYLSRHRRPCGECQSRWGRVVTKRVISNDFATNSARRSSTRSSTCWPQ